MTVNGCVAGQGSCPAVSVLGTLLRGAGQVMFQNSPWTGLLFLCGIAWGAWNAGRPEIFFGALLGLVVGTATGCLLGAPRSDVQAGLHGYNGILVGCALPVFLEGGAVCWLLIALGAMFSTVIMLAVSRVFASWKVSAMTGPFVFATWFILSRVLQLCRLRRRRSAASGSACASARRRVALQRGSLLHFQSCRRLPGLSHQRPRDGSAVSDRPCPVFAFRRAAWLGRIARGHGRGASARGGRCLRGRGPLSVQRRAHGHRHGHDLLSARRKSDPLHPACHGVHRGGAGRAQRGARAS